MDHQTTVFASREEELVVQAQSHPLNFTGVSLDFGYFLEPIEPPDLNSSRPAVLSNSREEVFA